MFSILVTVLLVLVTYKISDAKPFSFIFYFVIVFNGLIVLVILIITKILTFR